MAESRDNGGKFTDKDGAKKGYDSKDDLGTIKKAIKDKKKMTPAEKIASVHIDFDKDNILPELNEDSLSKIGIKNNKPVLLKKHIIDRNAEEHPDLTKSDFESIIANALYLPSDVFKANKDKPYYHFAKEIEITSKGHPKLGLALIDVDDNKDNFEIVHAHFVSKKSLERAKKKD